MNNVQDITTANGIATPDSWQPGDKIIVLPPATAEAAEARMNEGYECTDWYFCKKSLKDIKNKYHPVK